MTSATATRKPRKTPEERAAERAALTEQLTAFQAAVAELDGDDAIVARIMRMMERYSERNAALIVMQRPEATEVHGFGEWRALGRCVRKGEHGIRILVPVGRSADKEPTETKPDGEKGRQLFKIGFVFDVAQTDPIEQPEPVAEAQA